MYKGWASAIPSWPSIPAGSACPGSSNHCESVHRPHQDQTPVDCHHGMLIGAGLAGIALPSHGIFLSTDARLFWLLAFSSATRHCCRRIHMLALDSHEQALFVGIRSTFYRIATIAGQGLLIMLAGRLETVTGNIPYAWSITFFVLAGIFLAVWLLPSFHPPHPAADHPAKEVSASGWWKNSLPPLPPSSKKYRHRCHCIHAAIPNFLKPN